MKKEFDIENLALNLRQNLDILKCFDEFCDESIISTIENATERAIAVECFMNRMDTHRSLLNVAMSNLEEDYTMLDEFLRSPASKVLV